MPPASVNHSGGPLYGAKSRIKEDALPRFNIIASFDLNTSVEPDGVRFDGGYTDVEELRDESYFSSEDVTISGGDVRFTVEAENEDEAENIAQNTVSDGQEVEDGNGWTWLVENVSYDIEPVEEPMTLDRAITLVREAVAESDLGSEVQEALGFLLNILAQR